MEGKNKFPLLKKKIKGVEISNFEIGMIRMICDYLFVDRVKDMATFPRFEQCFGPFFSDDNNFKISEVYKEICGEKRKYITFRRMILSVLKWKSQKSSNKYFNHFMSTLFNSIIKKKNEVIGELTEFGQIFSTQNCAGRKAISKFGVFTDKNKNQIQGFLLEYDDSFNANLSFRDERDEVSLEINFHPYKVDDKYGKIYNNDRDGISHIGGKYDTKEKIIYLLIFKCHSGKTFYIGENSKRDLNNVKPFLFGTSRCQLKDLRIETIKNQLKYLEPSFQKSLRVNQNLLVEFDKIDEKFLDEDTLIFEEKEIQNISINDPSYDKYILYPCVLDDAFMDPSTLKEKKEGKKFKEIYQNTEKKNKITEVEFSIDSILEEAKKIRINEVDKDEKKISKMMSNGEFLTNTDDFDALLATIEKDLLAKK